LDINIREQQKQIEKDNLRITKLNIKTRTENENDELMKLQSKLKDVNIKADEIDIIPSQCNFV
jgi:hypothetical protein